MWKVRLPTNIGVGGKQMKPKQGFLAAVNLCIYAVIVYAMTFLRIVLYRQIFREKGSFVYESFLLRIH